LHRYRARVFFPGTRDHRYIAFRYPRFTISRLRVAESAAIILSLVFSRRLPTTRPCLLDPQAVGGYVSVITQQGATSDPPRFPPRLETIVFLCHFLFPRYTVRSIFHTPAFVFLGFLYQFRFELSTPTHRLHSTLALSRSFTGIDTPALRLGGLDAPGLGAYKTCGSQECSTPLGPGCLRGRSAFSAIRPGGIVDTNCNDDFHIRNPLVLFSTRGEYQHKKGLICVILQEVEKFSGGLVHICCHFPMVPSLLPFSFSRVWGYEVAKVDLVMAYTHFLGHRGGLAALEFLSASSFSPCYYTCSCILCLWVHPSRSPRR